MKLPFFAENSDAQPLMRVVQFVAARHGCSTYEVGLALFAAIDKRFEETPAT